MDSKVFKQMLSPFGLLIGGSIATFCFIVFEQIEKMGILYLSGHKKVILFFGITLLIWFMLILKNFYDYKINGRTDFGKNNNSISLDKHKAMYPTIPSRYLSKKPNDFTLGKYHRKYFQLPIDLNDITHCLVIGAPGSFKSSTLLNALIWNFNFAKEKDKFQFDEEVLYMKKSISRIIGVIMLIVAIVFIMFALNHPEKSFPWNNTITWLLYGIYFLVTVVLLIAPKMKK